MLVELRGARLLLDLAAILLLSVILDPLHDALLLLDRQCREGRRLVLACPVVQRAHFELRRNDAVVREGRLSSAVGLQRQSRQPRHASLGRSVAFLVLMLLGRALAFLVLARVAMLLDAEDGQDVLLESWPLG